LGAEGDTKTKLRQTLADRERQQTMDANSGKKKR